MVAGGPDSPPGTLSSTTPCRLFGTPPGFRYAVAAASKSLHPSKTFHLLTYFFDAFVVRSEMDGYLVKD